MVSEKVDAGQGATREDRSFVDAAAPPKAVLTSRLGRLNGAEAAKQNRSLLASPITKQPQEQKRLALGRGNYRFLLAYAR